MIPIEKCDLMSKMIKWYCDVIFETACIMNTAFHASEHVYKVSFWVEMTFRMRFFARYPDVPVIETLINLQEQIPYGFT